MSVHVSSCVWKHAPAKGNVLLVLLALADTAQDDGTCWPGYEFIARKTRLSKRTVMRCVDRLEEDGVVVKVVRPNTSNLYTIALCQGCQVDTPGGDNLTRGGVTAVTSRGDSAVTQTVNEPSMNRAAKRRRKPEAPLDPDWRPNANHIEQAAAKGLDVRQEFQAFSAHAAANDRRLRDWDAGFRMWLTKARPSASGPVRRTGWDRAFDEQGRPR